MESAFYMIWLLGIYIYILIMHHQRGEGQMDEATRHIAQTQEVSITWNRNRPEHIAAFLPPSK